mmetsp:Transcript_22673/g.47307  ORF Transcript_22673/g.47307 Transcript_22673/m.47307 type:complete len:236 (-) Transcript_22673:119-826(-)
MLRTNSMMQSFPVSMRLRLLAIPRVKASSMKRTPPRASSNTSRVLRIVMSLSRATRSMRSTSKNLGFLNKPSSWKTLAKRRATAVFPVPGFPVKTAWEHTGRPESSAKPAGNKDVYPRWELWRFMGMSDSRKSEISAVRRNPRTCDLTCSNPTIDANKSSTRSRGPDDDPRLGGSISICIDMPRESRFTVLWRFFTASKRMSSASSSRLFWLACWMASLNAISNSLGSIPAAKSA